MNLGGNDLVENVFLGLGLIGWFALLAAAELYCARRSLRAEHNSDRRLITNFGLSVLVLAASALYPVARIGSSAAVQSLGIGIAPRLGLSWPAVLIILLLVDSLAIYWTHRIMHLTPLFWRVHRVHHADRSVDVSTSLRNHPLELLLAIPTSAAVILIVGAPVSAVIAVQTIGLAATIWQHADIDLPPGIDRALSIVLVTPSVHRIHHNPERRLHDSNYGELITIWDRLFGTFNPSGERGRVGLDGQVANADGLFEQIWSPVYAA